MGKIQNAVIIIAIILVAMFFSVVKIDVILFPTIKPSTSHSERIPPKKEDVEQPHVEKSDPQNINLSIQIGQYIQDKDHVFDGRINWSIYKVDKISPNGKSILLIELINIKGDDLYYPKGKQAWKYISNETVEYYIPIKEENKKLLFTIK